MRLVISLTTSDVTESNEVIGQIHCAADMLDGWHSTEIKGLQMDRGIWRRWQKWGITRQDQCSLNEAPQAVLAMGRELMQDGTQDLRVIREVLKSFAHEGNSRTLENLVYRAVQLLPEHRNEFLDFLKTPAD